MATHSSVLAWRIPRTAEPGGLPSMGSHRVRHDWSDLAAAAADLLNSLAFSVIQQMLEIWSLVPFVNPAWTSRSSWFTYCWSLTWRIFEHYFAIVWDEYTCAVVWIFFGIVFLWDLNENWPFSNPVAIDKFSKFAGLLSVALSQHHLLGFEIAQLEFITSNIFVHSDAS